MNRSTAGTESPGVWTLAARGEPFRVLFPLGLVLGIVGVALWPLYALGWIAIYPAIAHQRIMIEGFVTSFVIGFLGTAMSRLLEHAGGDEAVLLVLTLLSVPLCIAIFSKLVCSAYLNIWKVWQVERKTGKPVVFDHVPDQ